MADIDRLHAVSLRPFAHQPITRLTRGGFDVGMRRVAFAHQKLRA
jgi:hypothetical protein